MTAGQVIKDLENLNSLTERDFLKVGEKLMEFRSTARQIASDMAAVSELIAGEHGRSASHALTRVLEHSSEMDARMEQSGRAMAEVRDLSGRIRLAFAGLRNRVSVFRTLCTLTQIETSRLGNSGVDFGDLATEVRPLSETIQSSGEGILEAASRLDQGVRSAIRSGSSLKARQLKELPALIDGITKNLKAFEEWRQRAVESSARQADQYGLVCDAIEGLVRSIQFHDITRQQIEHVAEALGELCAESQNGRNSSKSYPPHARVVLTVQSSQLSGAASVFASSIESMERDLESIAGQVRDMAKASRELVSNSTDDRGSFFLRMQEDLSAILKMLSTCSAAQADLQSTARKLDGVIAGMQSSVAEIGGIEIRIQRIATNATIRASHIGAAGDALNVIAGVMRGVALDSNADTEDVAATLCQMSATSGSVQGVSVPGDSGQAASGASAGTDEVIEEMKRTVLELHASSESSFSRVDEIAALGARLAGDIDAVRGGFSAGALFAEVVGRAMGELQRMGTQAAASSLGGASSLAGGSSLARGSSLAGGSSLEGLEVTQTPHLDRVAQHYTMQHERDIHQSVTGGSPIAEVAPIEVSNIALKDGDFGDNVELF